MNRFGVFGQDVRDGIFFDNNQSEINEIPPVGAESGGAIGRCEIGISPVIKLVVHACQHGVIEGDDAVFLDIVQLGGRRTHDHGDVAGGGGGLLTGYQIGEIGFDIGHGHSGNPIEGAGDGIDIIVLADIRVRGIINRHLVKAILNSITGEAYIRLEGLRCVGYEGRESACRLGAVGGLVYFVVHYVQTIDRFPVDPDSGITFCEEGEFATPGHHPFLKQFILIPDQYRWGGTLRSRAGKVGYGRGVELSRDKVGNDAMILHRGKGAGRCFTNAAGAHVQRP